MTQEISFQYVMQATSFFWKYTNPSVSESREKTRRVFAEEAQCKLTDAYLITQMFQRHNALFRRRCMMIVRAR